MADTSQKSSTFLIPLGIVLFFAIAVFAAYQYSEYQKSGKRIGPSSRKRFVSKTGKMRKGAKALVSKSAPKSPDFSSSEGRAADSDGLPETSWRGPGASAASPTEEADAPLTNEETLARSALDAINPAEGVQMLLQSLEEDPQGDVSSLYSSLGTLYAQTQPPDLAKAWKAFDKGMDIARKPEDLYSVLLARAQVMMRNDLHDSCLSKIEQYLDPADPVTMPGLKLRLVMGALLERNGNDGAAEEVFNGVLDDAFGSRSELGSASLDVYRESCLRLSKLYRSSGRERDAQQMLDLLKERMGVAKTRP